MVATYPALVRGDGGSGSGSNCNIGADRLPLSVSLSSTTASSALSAERKLLLNWLDWAQCKGLCVSGWSYCYHKDTGHTQFGPMAFSLWRQQNGSKILMEVKSSRHEVPARTLPAEQWFICERKELNDGCVVQVEPGDRVGVVMDMASSLRVVEDQVVEGGMMEGEVIEEWTIMGEDTRGEWVNTSLVIQEGHLMVMALVGQ